MKTLDSQIQTAVADQARTTPYRVLVEVYVGVTTYRWATAAISFGGNAYEGRLLSVGQIHGLILDGLRSSAAKRQFDFDLEDDQHTFAKAGTGYFSGAKVIVREIFDGIAVEGRHHIFYIERIVSAGRHKVRFECASHSPLTSGEKVGVNVEAGDYTTAEEGVVGTGVATIFGSRKIALKLVSAEEGRFEVGYGSYTINHVYQNGTEIFAGGGPDGFDGFTQSSVGNKTTIVFNTPSQIRNVAVSGAPILPMTAEVTRASLFWNPGVGEPGYGYALNNPINVFMEYWTLANGDVTEIDATSFNAAASSFATDGIDFNCAINGEQSVSMLLSNLLMSCGGRVVVSDAVYFYRNGEAPQNPEEFDESNILRDSAGKETTLTFTDLTLDAIHNRGVVTFQKWDVLAVNADTEIWRSVYEDSASIAAIGVQERVENSLFIGDWDVADRAVQAMIRQEVAGLREYSFETTLQAMAHDEGDEIALTWPDLGLNQQPCLVTNVQRLSFRRVQITARELAGIIWQDPGTGPVQPPSVDPALVKPSAPTWTSHPLQQSFRVEGDGTVFSDLTIAWNAVSHPLVSGYEIWIGLDGQVSVDGDGLPDDPDQLYDTIIGTTRVIYGVPVGVAFYVRIRALTANGLISDLSAEENITIQAKDTIYEEVTGQSYIYTESGLTLYWNAPSPDFKDFSYFEVAVNSGVGGYTVINQTVDHEITIAYSRLEDLLPSGETIRDGYVYVRAIDRSGGAGTWMVIHFINARPSAPTILTPSHGFLTIFLDSTPALDVDVIRREWQVVDDTKYQSDGWTQATFFAAHRNTSAAFAGEDGMLYHFRCRDIDWLADILGAADIALIPWSTEATESTESVPSASVGFDTLASLTTKNHIRNAGFERWPSTLPDFWTTFGGGDADQETTNPFSGAISAKVWGATGTQGGIYCDFTNSLDQFAGKNATVSFRYKTPAANPATAASVRISTGVGDSGTLGDVTPSGTWQFKAFTFGIPSNATALAVNLYGDRNQTSLATLFDEVMVQIGEFVTTFELHDLDFLGDSGGVDETMIADDSITTPKIKANNVVAKHILANQIAAKEIYAAADRVTASGTVYKCKVTHGPGTPAIYDHGNHEPPVAGDWADYWEVDAGADPTHYPSWVSGSMYFGGTVLADQIRAQGAIITDAHIATLGVDKLRAGTLTAGETITGADGTTWDETGLHLSLASTIDWDSIENVPSLGGATIYYQATQPGAPPAVNGDYWIDTDDDSFWRYNGSIWDPIQDADIQAALTAAGDAQATADGKIVCYAQASQPTGQTIGDIWIETDQGNRIRRWDGSTWAVLQDAGIAQAIAAAATAQATANGKIVTFYQATMPGGSEGDLWVDTDDGNKLYRRNLSGWVPVQDAGISQALANAATAQETADGKIITFYQSTPPSSGVSSYGDLWFDTDDSYRPYRYDNGWHAMGFDVATWSKIISPPSWIHTTYISSTEIQSPKITGNTGQFGTSPSGTTGIKIDGTNDRIHHGSTWYGTSSIWGLSGRSADSPKAYFRGEVDISGTDGYITLNPDSNVPNINVGNSSGYIMRVAPGLTFGMAISYDYNVALYGRKAGGGTISPATVLRIDQGYAGSAISAYGTNKHALLLSISYGAVYGYSNVNGTPGVEGANSYDGGYGVYGHVSGLGGRGVYGRANGVAATAVIGEAIGSSYAGGNFFASTIWANYTYGLVATGPTGTSATGYGGVARFQPSARTVGSTPTHAASLGTLWVDGGGRLWIYCQTSTATKWYRFDIS